MNVRALAAAGVIAAMAFWGALAAHATPDRAFWYRETLLGENDSCFFRLVSIRDQPGSYYSYADTQRVEEVRKRDGRVLASTPVLRALASSDFDTNQWTVRYDTLAAFDLAGYLRAHRVAAAMRADYPIVCDARGLRATYRDGDVLVMSRAEILRRAPRLEVDFALAGIENTGNLSDGGLDDWIYLRFVSGSDSYDTDNIEYLIPIQVRQLHD